jgi:hypothetical protein
MQSREHLVDLAYLAGVAARQDDVFHISKRLFTAKAQSTQRFL